jgi:hypothetical protein
LYHCKGFVIYQNDKHPLVFRVKGIIATYGSNENPTAVEHDQFLDVTLSVVTLSFWCTCTQGRK